MSYNYPFNPPYAGGSQQHPGSNNPYQQPPNQQPNYPQHPYQQSPYQQPPHGCPPHQQAPYQQPPHVQAYPQQPYYPSQPSAPPSQYEPPPAYNGALSENILKNPNFEPVFWNQNGETKQFKSEPWQILETGGDGWQLEKGPHGSSPNGCPVDAGPYAHCVVGSSQWCKRSQTINLAKKGITAQIMDHQKPCIHVYEWFCARSDCSSEYEMNVTLLGKHKNPLDHFSSGIRSAGSQDWQKIEHKFLNYPTGVRFIQFQDGTKDRASWAGQYGAKMCQPTVKVLQAQPAPVPAPVPAPTPSRDPTTFNLLANPSFTAKHWNGNSAGAIDYYPWHVERNEGGYALERNPSGSGASYPTELSGFDIWCIATSNDTSQRCQTVDLVQKGYSPQFLDQHRPSIRVSEWFASRNDCEGEYFMEAYLLDQDKNKIPGFSFNTGLKIAPSRHWNKEEHIFRNIPYGVRFVQFRDGGNDKKFWAGNYGVKMVGAFVGVLQNAVPAPAPTPAPSSLPPKKNLIRNPSFVPRGSWNDNNCEEIEFSPWTIIANGGDGVILEKTPYGSGASGYPPELGSTYHCIASSHEWFRRQQTVDLIENGFLPHMFQDRTMQIYVCEWFTSRGDCIGEYELKASILNEREDVIPGYTFSTGLRKAPGDRWEKVGHLFSAVPENARYVRFEDASKDTRRWAGHYGARMVGATVIAGKGMENFADECVIL